MVKGAVTFRIGQDKNNVGMAEAQLGPDGHLVVALVESDSMLVLLHGQPLGQPEVVRSIEGLVAELLLKWPNKRCVKS